MKCKECKWWEIFDSQDEKGGGFCHRFPPVLLGQVLAGTDTKCAPMDMEDGQWVVTNVDGWCGEFISKVKTEIKELLEKKLGEFKS